MAGSHPTGKFDNSARDYRHIEARPLAAAMGAEIAGVQAATLSDPAFEEVRDALFRHKMIYFRDQDLSHADHERFSLRFGPFAEDAYTKGMPGHVNVQPVIKSAESRTGWVFGAGWHSDSPFLREPPAITILHGVDIPPYGGDTLWANAALAYDMLSDTMKRMIEGLRVHMSMHDVLEAAQTFGAADETPVGRLVALKGKELPADMLRNIEGRHHPLVRTHPVTGEKALFCDSSYSVGIEGLSAAEAKPLLDFLAAHISQPAFTCRLRWEPKTLTMWDNRLCQHQAFNDYDGFRREMYRTTVAGEVPR